METVAHRQRDAKFARHVAKTTRQHMILVETSDWSVLSL